MLNFFINFFPHPLNYEDIKKKRIYKAMYVSDKMECESYEHSLIIILSFSNSPFAARWKCNKGNSFYFFFVQRRWGRRRQRKDEAVVHDEKETVEGGKRINIFLLDGYELQAIRKKIIVPKDDGRIVFFLFLIRYCFKGWCLEGDVEIYLIYRISTSIFTQICTSIDVKMTLKLSIPPLKVPTHFIAVWAEGTTRAEN